MGSARNLGRLGNWRFLGVFRFLGGGASHLGRGRGVRFVTATVPYEEVYRDHKEGQGVHHEGYGLYGTDGVQGHPFREEFGHVNGAFKTTVAHRNHEGIGRWYGKGARRVDQKKVSDEGNHTWEDRKWYSYDELVADDRRDSAEWNGMLHPDQKRYPGMTRWDVLVAKLNPTLRPLDDLTLARYIGEKVETSIRRNSTVTVANELSSSPSSVVAEDDDLEVYAAETCFEDRGLRDL